jgi:hypothetical protein
VFREVPYQTVHADLFNIRKRAINVQSLFRWDSRKQRLNACLSGPFNGPAWRYNILADARREYWQLSEDHDLLLQLQRVGFELRSAGRTSWRNELSMSYRKYDDLPYDSALFAEGYSIKYLAGLDREIFRIPESRWTLSGFTTLTVGNMLSQSDFLSTIETGVTTEWLPRAQGNDDAFRFHFRIGRGFGAIPFDQLFVLGMQTDNNLWLRAHVSLRGDKKATFPIGKSYALLNSEFDKGLFSTTFFRVGLSPFFDAGKTSSDFSSQTWQLDTGVQWKVRVLQSALLNFCLGRNLRTGKNSFYFTVSNL